LFICFKHIQNQTQNIKEHQQTTQSKTN